MLEVALVVSLLFSSVLHHEATRDKGQDLKEDVAGQIYSVSGERSRGTGFVAVGASGKKYIVTNAHVCDQPLPVMEGRSGTGHKIKLKIVREYWSHDLCLLSPFGSGFLPDPLPLANTVYAEEQVYIVGHPLIDAMTVTTGKAVAYHHIAFPIGTELEKCNKPKYFVDDYPSRDDKGNAIIVPVCFFQGVTLATTVPTDGGASGSPLLNKHGEVVGVVMATAGNISWGEAVPLRHLKKFLENN